ncbi:hypothetical protein [Bernardetia sp. MNP-M8]|uniref:hypothetical protein n=1 Tax=Bernardetia sp. MNP-M8 TaxID=3127470 RepID=UPI0030D16BE4
MNLPSYNDIEKIHFWVPPQPCSLMLTLFDREGQEIKVNMFPTDEGLEMLEKEEYTPPPNLNIPRRLYINEELVEHNASLEKKVINILSNLIRDNRLGHPEGLTVIMAQEMIDYFK